MSTPRAICEPDNNDHRTTVGNMVGELELPTAMRLNLPSKFLRNRLEVNKIVREKSRKNV